MNRLARLASLLPLIFAAATAGAAPRGAHWDYQGPHGAAHWAELDGAFETCARGQAQSPINIRHAVKAELPALDFLYARDASPTLVNNGHTVQVNLPAGSALTVGDQRYELLQFHFHTPSEEAVAGRRTAMVAHLVHRDAQGALGVVGVLIQPGRHNAAWAPIFAHLPRKGESVQVSDLTLDLAALLPADHRYYDFSGSLTTPPCSEGVHWMVLKQPIQLSAAQIRAFRQLFPANARPLQPLNGRVIRESL